MSTPPSRQAAPHIRFDVFDFDPDSGDLWKDGCRTRLPDQARIVLRILLDRSGAVVSRAELRQLLWSDDTFVDFDTGLNVVMTRIRQALGDSAAAPRYIETVPRRGYRFVAPVAVISTVPVIRALAVLPFENLSGDEAHACLADGMEDALITALACLRTLRVVPRQSMKQYRGTTKSIAAIGRELDVDALIAASITPSGDRIHLTIQLIDVAGERHVWVNSYDEERREVLRLQHTVAHDVIRAIRVTRR